MVLLLREVNAFSCGLADGDIGVGFGGEEPEGSDRHQGVDGKEIASTRVGLG